MESTHLTYNKVALTEADNPMQDPFKVNLALGNPWCLDRLGRKRCEACAVKLGLALACGLELPTDLNLPRKNFSVTQVITNSLLRRTFRNVVFAEPWLGPMENARYPASTDAIMKLLNGAMLTLPVGLRVVTSAMGRGMTAPANSL